MLVFLLYIFCLYSSINTTLTAIPIRQYCYGNLDPITNCSTCRNHWTNIITECTICPSNWNISDDCNSCVYNWNISTDCQECLYPYTEESNCLEKDYYSMSKQLLYFAIIFDFSIFIIIVLIFVIVIYCCCYIQYRDYKKHLKKGKGYTRNFIKHSK